MKLVVSCEACPRIEMAASCRPAIQPSVRVSSAAMSSAERFRSHHLVEKIGGFGGGEAQVGGAQLGQLASGTQPGQGKLWILTGGDDQVHLRRQVLDQKGEGVVNRLGVDQVVVVKDEDEAFREGGDLVDQGGQKRFGRRWLRGLERSQHIGANARCKPSTWLRASVCKSRDEVGQKAVGSLSPSSSDSQATGARNRRPTR